MLLVFHIFHIKFLVLLLDSFKWHHCISSTICPLAKAKTYCKTCWTQMGNKKPPQSSVTATMAVQCHCRLMTDV